MHGCGWLLLLAWVIGCSRHDKQAPAIGRAAPIASEARAQPAPRMVVFQGSCDASGAVALDQHRFAVADDEDNVLRVYDADRGGPPLESTDLSPVLQLENNKHLEADLEAATRVGNVALWLSSHARSKQGRVRPNRLRFFATDMPGPGHPFTIQGRVYSGLLDDLLADSRAQAFALAAAASRPPAAEGGLNIEGMTAMPDGRVLLGFRNPIPRGRALLVSLTNPLRVFDGEAARFGDFLTLDLAGLGVRALAYWHGRYLIAAGSIGDSEQARLFQWQGPGAAVRELHEAQLQGLRPEAFFTPEQGDRVMLLSDDGGHRIGGERCKDLRDPAEKRFRGLWLRPGA